MFFRRWPAAIALLLQSLLLPTWTDAVRSGGQIVFPDGDRQRTSSHRPTGRRTPPATGSGVGAGGPVADADKFDLLHAANLSSVRDFLGVFGLTELPEDALVGRRKSPDIPMQANCQLELRTVDLDAESNAGRAPSSKDAETLLFPKCVRVKRCAGCCDLADRTVCTPTKKTTKQIRRAAIRLKRSSNGPVPEASTQMASVEVHEECRCVCRVQAEDCSDQQEYHPDECRCVCQNSEAELACRNAKDKTWDANECKCRCQNQRYCSTGLTFSQATCSCVPN